MTDSRRIPFRTPFAVLTLGLAPFLLAEPAEKASLPPLDPPPFVEATVESGLDFVHWNGMSGRFYFPEVVGSGGALFDFDLDGDLDLYLAQGTFLGSPDNLKQATFPPPERPGGRLYRNDLEPNAEGVLQVRFVDVTEASGLKVLEYGMGVATGDYDNDGRPDLYLTHFGANQLWRNLGPDAQGTVRFEDVTAEAGVGEPRWSVPAVFTDLDGDGWLDLYVGNYVDYSVPRNKTCLAESGLRDYCGPSSYTAITDRLFRNLGPDKEGHVRFEDISQASKVGTTAAATLGASAADFDGDGRTDLYIANDQSANFLWLQQGQSEGGVPTFLDDALLLGCALNESGVAEASMGIATGDIDGDGDDDLFLTHLKRESNTLYLNDGSGLFHDRSIQSGLATPSWQATGFGTALVDFENDGRLDLFTANGAVYILFELARRGDAYPLHQPNQLFANRGGDPPAFEEVSAQGGDALATSEVSRGVLVGDVNNDGSSDLVVTNNSGPARLLLGTAKGSWLGLRLVTGDPPRDALGARVTVLRQGRPSLVRTVRTDGSYASAGDPRLLFGLGDEPRIQALDVQWPGGQRERFAPFEAGRYHTLRQGTGQAVADEAPLDNSKSDE